MKRLLMPHLPMTLLLVRRIDEARSVVETVGVGPEHHSAQLLSDRTDCAPAHMTRLLNWCRHGNVSWRRHSDCLASDLAPAVPLALQGDLLIGPLANAQGMQGLLLLQAHAQRRFTSHHAQMLQTLLEPFSTALENDRRWGELTTQCRTLEADRQTLLRRLGKEDLSETVIGADSGLRLVMGRVALVSRSDVPVLLHGEPGAGKAIIARTIHRHSSRSMGPFLHVNCRAVPPEAIHVELFGQSRDGFTGAGDAGNTWLERAHGGTLFLDEIDYLPSTSQTKLLRVLQEGAFERMGGSQPIKVDVRIIAATRRDLTTMVQRGLFREDLWYRIATFPIVLPPLRERPEDIPALAAHFAQRAAVRFGLASPPLSTDDMARLNHYAWPGNIRELAVVIERAVLLGDGKRLDIAHALGASSDTDNLSWHRSKDTYAPRRPNAVLEPLDVAMKQHIEAALSATRGRVEGPHGAARLLDINPYTLRGRMRKLGIDWHTFRAVTS